MSKSETFGQGPYRVEQEIGGMKLCYQAPTKEEALQMAGMAIDPAVFLWDAKVVTASELDDYIFDGWEPVNAFQSSSKDSVISTISWSVRRKVYKPKGDIGIIDDE